MRKGQTSSALGMAVAIIMTAIALVAGLWVYVASTQSMNIPLQTYGVSNETISFATNNTLYDTTTQASCISTEPYATTPGNCGIVSVTRLTNASLDLGVGNVTVANNGTSDTMQLFFALVGAADFAEPGDWDVTYTYRDFYSPAQTKSGLTSLQTTTFNAFQLAIIVIIVIAAVTIISILIVGFKDSGGV